MFELAHSKSARLGRQVVYVIVTNIALLFLGLIQIPVLTKGLGTAGYGTWSLITTTILLIVPFALLGQNSAIIRFLSAEKDKNRIGNDFVSIYSVVFLSGAAFSMLMFFLSDWLAGVIFGDTNTSSYIKLASVLVLFNALDALSVSLFRIREKIGLYNMLILSRNVLQLGLIILFLLLGYELNGVIIAAIVSGAAFFLIELGICLRQVGLHIPKFSNIKRYLKWGIPIIPDVGLLWIISSSDRYLVGYFLGVTATGIYNAAYTIAAYASLTLVPIGIVLYPAMVRSYERGDRKETAIYLQYIFKYFMMIAIPSAFGLSVLAQPLVSILAKPDFVSGSIAVSFVAFGVVLFALYRFSSYIIYLANKTHVILRVLGLAAAINIVLNIVLIPRIELAGAAIATFIAYGTAGFLGLAITRQYLKFDLQIYFVLKSILTSTIMTLGIWLFNPESVTQIILSIISGIAIYFGIMFLIKGISKSELEFLPKLVSNRLGRNQNR